jgi:dihydropteroate synthase
MYLNLRGTLLSLQIPQIMGILNVTSDSFYAASRMQSEKAILKRV